MSENAIDSETISKTAPDTAKPKGARKASKKGKRAKKAARANKKAEVIAMMKRAKGATLPEIVKATGNYADFVALLKKGLRPPIPLTRQRHSPHRSKSPQISLAISANRSDDCDDRNPVKEKLMSENAIDSENMSKPAPDTAKPKGSRKASKKAKALKKAGAGPYRVGS